MSEVRLAGRSDFTSQGFRGVVARIGGGGTPLRCRRCNMRWETSVWDDGDWKFARCPKCYRQELTTWSEHYYNPGSWITLKLRLCATPYRCAACRCNFASFNKCKETFSWRHQERLRTPAEIESETESAE